MWILFLRPALMNMSAGLVHEGGGIGRLRGDGKRACLDASHVEQVAYEAAHAVGLVGDDAVELAHFGGVEGGCFVEEGICGALD